MNKDITTKELTAKEYAKKYHYDTSYLCRTLKAGKHSSLPDIISIRKLGTMWLITVKNEVEETVNN